MNSAKRRGKLREIMWGGQTRCAGCGFTQSEGRTRCANCGQQKAAQGIAPPSARSQEGATVGGRNPYLPPTAEVSSWLPLGSESAADLASRGSRLVASCIDGALLLAVAYAYTVLDHVAGMKVAFTVAFVFLTGVQMGGTALRGQTIGKHLCRIRVDYQGGPPGFIRGVLFRGGLPAVLLVVPVAGVLFALVDTLFIFQRDQRCIHDWVAGTTVLRRPVG